jgi:UDP-GlcNAc:undecaprenyl-phosphate GlcNAc-1-phosphate transferase
VISVTSLSFVFVVFGAAAALVALFVPIARRLARVGGLFEQPVENRWHRQPVPKLGGAGMAVAFLLAGWPVARSSGFDLLMAAPLAMFVLGLVDDLRPIRPSAKFAAQIVTAVAFLLLAPGVSITGRPLVDALVAVVWFVGITNAFNLLDNIDGLAAGVATIAGVFLVASLLLSGSAVLAALALPVAAIAGVAAGFLIYNWHPASIFMGNSGSHLLGAFFASATLLAVPHLQIEGGGATIAVVLLLVPCADTALVILTRQLSGRSAFVGGRDHLSHRLVALGTDDRAAVLLLYAVAAAGGFAALALQTLGAKIGWAIVASYAAAVGALGVYLAHVDVRSDLRRRSRLPLPTELTARYRVYEVALDVLLISLAYYLGLVTRFREPERFSIFLAHFTDILPVVATIHVAGLWMAGKYRRTPFSTPLSSAVTILRGGALGSAGAVIAVLYLTRFEGYSRIAFAVAAVFVVALLWSEHVALGALFEFLRRRQRPDRLAIVYGAGRRGELAVRELSTNAARGLTPFGFIDDDPARRRDELQGIPVLGTLDDLDRLLRDARGDVSTVVVAIESLPENRFDRLCATCDRHKVEVQRLRFSLDEVDTDLRNRRPGVVRFPRG